MTPCPQCGKKMNQDFLNGLMGRLESGYSKLSFSFPIPAECCGKQLMAINELNMYYIISEPAKPGEEKIMIGAK